MGSKLLWSYIGLTFGVVFIYESFHIASPISCEIWSVAYFIPVRLLQVIFIPSNVPISIAQYSHCTKITRERNQVPSFLSRLH